MEEIKYNDFLREHIYLNTLSSGVKCYIIPKKNYVEKQAVVTVNYGSADNSFEADGQVSQYPDGIAHFLEHKLFEDKNINMFEAFTKRDADVNAYTNYTNTAYYFSCNRNFDDNFKLLLDLVQNPHFTDENVEKEKGIIIQEINMYRDDPFWRGFLSMHEAMYFENPIRRDIAGTEESVNAINKDMLYECYNMFYTPENMAIVCVGDFEPDSIYKMAEEFIKIKKAPAIKRIYGNEPNGVRERYAETHMQSAMPMFHIGFKDNSHEDNSKICDTMAAMRLLADYIAGDGSALYERLYEEGLIDNSFSLDYSCGIFFGYTVFSGLSGEPENVNEAILNEIKIVRERGLDAAMFERLRKKHMGRLFKTFNAIHSITVAQVDFFSKQRDLFDLMHSYEAMDVLKAERLLKERFSEENNVLSVVR